MLHVLDSSVANVTNSLRAADLWAQTLLIVSSDNGGVGAQGNNFPLRGSKMTPVRSQSCTVVPLTTC